MSRTFYYRPGHPKANDCGMVEECDLDAVPEAPTHVPIVSDLYMDGHVTVDGVDIGSRRKRQDYMRRTGSLDASDFSHGYYENERKHRERAEERSVRESVIETYRRLRKA